jgi:protein tyrosine phosphatase
MISNTPNFREINCGKIPSKLLYRSSQPIYNGKQVKDIILAANNAKIQTIVNLADNTRSLKEKIICCPWYRKIFEKNNVIALDMDMNFNIMDARFFKKIKDCLIFLMEHEPPYLIHCEAGIDRTGFLSILLESFMGAKFDDLAKDYMLSFVDDSEYSLDDHKNGSKFVINVFSKIKGEPIDTAEDLQYLSTKYLLEKVRLSNDEARILTNRLMSQQPGQY